MGRVLRLRRCTARAPSLRALATFETTDLTPPSSRPSQIFRVRPQVPCSVQIFPGKTHTDLLLEDAFRGGRDLLADTITAAVTGRPHRSSHARMVPAPLVWLAGRVCPF